MNGSLVKRMTTWKSSFALADRARQPWRSITSFGSYHSGENSLPDTRPFRDKVK